MGLTFDDYVRALNTILAFICMGYAIRLYHWWITRPRGNRFILLSLFLMILALAYGNVEAIIQDAPAGARVFFYTVPLAFCIYGEVVLSASIHRYKKRTMKEAEENDRH